MVFGIVLLVLGFTTAILVVTSNPNKDEAGPVFAVFTFVGFLFLIGGICLYGSGVGEICPIGLLDKSPIYKLDGKVQTSQGYVVILENGKGQVYAVNATASDDAEFVKISNDNTLHSVQKTPNPPEQENTNP